MASIHSASTKKLASEHNHVLIDDEKRQMLDTLKKIRDYKVEPKIPKSNKETSNNH